MPNFDHVRAVGPKTFISYSFDDAELASRLDQGLRKRGHHIQREDLHSLAGQQLTSAIRTGIENADVLVQLLTPASAQSDWVRQELEMAKARIAEGHSLLILPVVLEDVALSDDLADWWHFALDTPEISDVQLDQLHAVSQRALHLLPLAEDDPFCFDQAALDAAFDSTQAMRSVRIDPDNHILGWAEDTLEYARAKGFDGFLRQEERYSERLPTLIAHVDAVTGALIRALANHTATHFNQDADRRRCHHRVFGAFSKVVLGDLVLRAASVAPPSPHPLRTTHATPIEKRGAYFKDQSTIKKPYMDEGYYRGIISGDLLDACHLHGEFDLVRMEIGMEGARPVRLLVPDIMFGSMKETYTQFPIRFDPNGEVLDGHFMHLILWQIAVHAYFNYPSPTSDGAEDISEAISWRLEDYDAMGLS